MGKTQGLSNSPPTPGRSTTEESAYAEPALTPGDFDPTWQQAEEAINWETSQLIMVVGLPGSGKSTWATLMAERQGAVVIASDDIREEMFTDLAEANRLGAAAHQRVFAEAHTRMRAALNAGKVVIADSTHLYPHARQPIEEMAQEHGVPLQIVFFDNAAEAARRNAARPEAKRVPEEAMARMQQAAVGLGQQLPGTTHVLR